MLRPSLSPVFAVLLIMKQGPTHVTAAQVANNAEKEDTFYRLFYFNHRWRGEGARLIFAQADVPYDDVRVSEEEWINLKPMTPFGHLPVLEFDGNQLGESFAINRYLARQFDLAGNGSLESAYVDSIADAFKDFFDATGKAIEAIAEGTSANNELVYTETIAPARDAFLHPLGRFLEKAGSGYVVGNSVSWADLLITEYLATCQSLIPGFLDCCPNIDAYVKRIRNLPNIKKWIEERPETNF